jgi:cytoskeletal protein RodZ
MSIEGLGKKLQDARLKRGLTLDEAARMTKIRPSRLAEIEADDFSNFPSLAYVKGFLLIYGKFLDVDVSEFMEAFDTPEQVTVDGYSYLQDTPAPKPARTPIVRRSSSGKTSLMPFFIGVVVIVLGFMFMKFILNILRVSPRTPPPAQMVGEPSVAPTAAPTPTPTAVVVATPRPKPVVVETPRPTPVETMPPKIAAAPTMTQAPTIMPTNTPAPTSSPTAVAVATPPTKEPEVRRAQPVRAEDLAKAGATQTSPTPSAASPSPVASGGQNQVAIRPLRRTYIKVVVDNEARTPAFERWISPSDGTVEFKGQHVDIRILDRDAVQIRKNGKSVADGDIDVTIE